MYRIGLGYDIHKLKNNGKGITLGGIFIPFYKEFIAHSDGDVLIHALIDALLGACTNYDIGEVFPDTDLKFKDIKSSILLKDIYKRFIYGKYKIVNIDCVVILQKPKLKNFKSSIRENIATLLDLAVEDINVKAKTNEGLDSIGKEQSIAAYCVVLVKKIN